MAVTKIHPIKSTLKKALDYIENPDKTDGKLFVSSYGCSYETADIEFQMLLDQAYQKGNNLAHHLIQAFEPGETTAEQAHEIGRQLADEVLQGKYPYVITTHIDKGHLHSQRQHIPLPPARQRRPPVPALPRSVFCSPASSGRSRQAAAAPASGTGPD